MPEFYVDMALSIVFSVLRQKQYLTRWELAFRKLFTVIGLAYGWTECPPGLSELVKTRKV